MGCHYSGRAHSLRSDLGLGHSEAKWTALSLCRVPQTVLGQFLYWGSPPSAAEGLLSSGCAVAMEAGRRGNHMKVWTQGSPAVCGTVARWSVFFISTVSGLNVAYWCILRSHHNSIFFIHAVINKLRNIFTCLW